MNIHNLLFNFFATKEKIYIFSIFRLIQYLQFNPRKRHVRRPVGKRFDERYTVQTMENPPSAMVW